MTDSLIHPTPDRLDALVEGSLPVADAAVVESHLLECGRCQTEVEELRHLFAALMTVGRPIPSVGFADRVMTGVRVPRTAAATWLERLWRLLPSTVVGWTIAGVLLALPFLGLVGAAAWIYSRPWLSLQGVLVFGVARSAAFVQEAGRFAAEALLQTALGGWAAEGVQFLLRTGAGGGGAALALLAYATLTAVSLWILYHNLFRTPSRDSGYASFSF